MAKCGISRVILGTIALKILNWVKAAAFPSVISRLGQSPKWPHAAEGWLEDSDIEAVELVRDLKIAGFCGDFYRYIARWCANSNASNGCAG